MLEIQGPDTTVEVTTPIAPLSSPKYTQPLRDTPQTITVIPKAVIEQQGATTLSDVLRNVPGLTITAGEGGAPAGDNLTLRGFSARNDIFVDGVRDLGPQSRDPFNLEQVEVTKGPTSAFTGRGSTGGAINLVSKAPASIATSAATLNLGTDDTRRVTADVNVPLERLGLGERTAFRLNFLAHDSGVAGRDVVENERWGVAPSLAFGLGTPTRLTLSYFKLKQDNISDYGIPWVPATNNALAALSRQARAGAARHLLRLRIRDFEKLSSDTGDRQVRARLQRQRRRCATSSATAARRATRSQRRRASPATIRRHQPRNAVLAHRGRDLGQPDRSSVRVRDRAGSSTRWSRACLHPREQHRA